MRKIRLISKFTTSATEKHNCNTHIAQYVNVKFGQLIEYNLITRKFFSWEIIRKMYWRNYSQTPL